MELLSKAYVRAVVAQAGCACDEVNSDFGVDFTIRAIIQNENRYVDEGGFLDIQLKSTTLTGIRIMNGSIHYDLAIRNYDHLRKEVTDRPARLLVLYVMPEDERHWLAQDRESLSLRHLCYYHSLRGFPTASNQRTITVAIREENVFSVNFLQQLSQGR